MEFSHPFSSTTIAPRFTAPSVQTEGCPTYPKTLCTGPDGTTSTFLASEGLANVLSISYFPGTAVGPSFCAYTDPSVNGCAPTSVDYFNWKYSDAPMNYLQIYNTDIQYALGLGNCSMLQLEGRPSSTGVAAKAPDVSTCEVQPTDPSYADVQATQQLLNLTSQKQLSISEPALLPAIAPNGIVPASSSTPTIQSGEWASIYGSNLASGTAYWTGNFPTALVGTSVTIDGKPAYLTFVSPGQIDLQVPTDATTGAVPVVVTTPYGSATATVMLAQFAPSFFLQPDGKHVAGIIPGPNGSYSTIGPTGNSLGYPTVAAKAGDTVELFATGFGPTSPVVPVGQAFSGAAPTTNPVTILINKVSVTPSFAGLAGAGLYQINVTIPSGIGTGDVPLQASVGGAQTPSGVVVSLQ
jgi:uncharacterized protein (TIGR03437 family)